jgi:hypothetical protein
MPDCGNYLLRFVGIICMLTKSISHRKCMLTLILIFGNGARYKGAACIAYKRTNYTE